MMMWHCGEHGEARTQLRPGGMVGSDLMMMIIGVVKLVMAPLFLQLG